MHNNCYTLYLRNIERALAVLKTLRNRETITAAQVENLHRQRHTADIVLQSEFDALRRAFITPIDREDLWLLFQVTEQLAEAAEDIPLTLYRHQQSCPALEDTALLTAVTDECNALHNVFSCLLQYPRNDAIVKQLISAEKAHRQTQKTNGATAEKALHRLSAACAAAVRTTRYVVLKMT